MSLSPYDLLPYPSQPQLESHIDRMYVVSELLGRSAPEPESARVLDLGCGTGIHVLSMARAYPHAEFVGIDASPVQVAMAQVTAAVTGTRNAHFECLDLREADLGTFDYIICHGTYSWVDAQTRSAILEHCATGLRDGGVAAVSYNALPGWHALSMFRQMMAYHARDATTDVERIAAARHFIGYLASAVGGKTHLYAAWVRRIAQIFAGVPDAYVLHEFLSQENQPFYLHEFLDHLAAHDLHYLSDATLAVPRLRAQAPEVADFMGVQRLEHHPAPRLHLAQCLDHVVDRTFRTAFITRDPYEPTESPSLETLRTRWFRAEEHDPGRYRDEAPRSALGDRDRDDALVQRTLSILGSARPHWVSFDALANELASAARPRSDATDAQLAQRLWLALLDEQVDVRHAPPRTADPDREHPVGDALARFCALRGDHDVPSMSQRAVVLTPTERAVLGDLTGEYDRSHLVARWETRHTEDSPGPAPSPRELDRILHRLARCDLLCEPA